MDTNIPFLQNLLQHPDFLSGEVHTRFVDENIAVLARPVQHGHRHAEASAVPVSLETAATNTAVPDGAVAIAAPMRARLLSLEAEVGALVQAGTTVAVLEAMKMELSLPASTAGRVLCHLVPIGETVEPGQHVLLIEPLAVSGEAQATEESIDLDHIRADLQAVIDAHAPTLDVNRPSAVARRRRSGQRTARENIEDLCDPGSFVEYGALTLAAQRARRSMQELIDLSPADGLVAGLGSINGTQFGDDKSRCMVLAYDYTVFAGTQGFHGHKKKDRMLQLAERLRLPLVIFAEGGGGRPGEVDVPSPVNLANMSFWHFARLSGLVPLIGIVSGRCFAGNAALLGCCDVVIATENASIGMGGPAMIEGGGLGRFSPEEVGPVSFQATNGVIDILVRDESEAVAAAKQYLSYFQGPVEVWRCPDQRLLRHLVPERRTRAYEVRTVIDTLADTGSVLELRRGFGRGMVTAFMRFEGRPMGVIANNPMHEGGAVASDEADKASRFVELCDAFDIPVLSLCDTPGFMVGPASEKQAAVRHVCRMFLTGASIDIPFFTVVLRKAYGLGAQAMAGGGFHGNNSFTVAWPTGEIGAMGLEGAVNLAYRNELAAIADPEARNARFQALVDDLYARGNALNIARFLSLDDVIDPADTRRWIMRALRSAPTTPPRYGKKRPHVDAW
ncbi:carboxyl transferase domain-containing protein [Siccirubricoccus deserti]